LALFYGELSPVPAKQCVHHSRYEMERDKPRSLQNITRREWSCAIPFVQRNGTSHVPYDEAIPTGHDVTDEDPPPGFVNSKADCRVGPCAREAGYGVSQP